MSNTTVDRTEQVVRDTVEYAKRVRDGLETVKPGQPLRFTEGCTINDRIWQGDLAITMCSDKIPAGYKKVDTKVQLVPGNNIGAKHCLDGTDGVEMYLHDEWNEETLRGPYIVLSQERTVIHPVHGSVTMIPGCYQMTYQREQDLEEKKARRAAD